MNQQNEQQNNLGTVSLALGIGSAALVFSIGFCGVLGAQGGWLPLAGIPLFACGAASAFLGFLGFIVGTVGLFSNRSKTTAVTGVIISIMGMCLFLVFLAAIRS